MSRFRNIGSEIVGAMAPLRGALIPILTLSAVLNILALSGSFFMLLVYDEVLPSHSVPTLVALLIMVTMAFGFQAMLDVIRSRAMIQAGALLDSRLSDRIYDVLSRYELRFGPMREGMMPVRDLDSVRAFVSGQGPLALLDLPWVLLFLGILFGFHWAQGLTALAGLVVMVVLMLVTDRLTKEPTRTASSMGNARFSLAETTRRNAEVIRALGMGERTRTSWRELSASQLHANDQLAEVAGRMQSLSKTFRQLLQSLMLAVGAYLVIKGDASGGIIIAGSILSARALMPVEQTIANWKGLTAARQAWDRLDRVLQEIQPEARPLPLPAPQSTLEVQGLVSGPPGQQTVTLSNVSFSLKAGDALAIVGRSGSGKSTLMRVLVGIWPVLRGAVRLDGATMDQWAADDLGQRIGYVPQNIELFDGTIAQNISRFDPAVSADKVIAAAKAADVHDLIVHLPGGYEYQLGPGGGNLSAGQKQRVALARALYDDPFLIVLDEPNSNLDTDGEAALGVAIEGAKARGAIVIIVAHRPAVLTRVDYIMVMANGQIRDYGTRTEILSRLKLLPPQPPAAQQPPADSPPPADKELTHGE